MGVFGSAMCVEQVPYSHLIIYPSDMLNTVFFQKKELFPY